VADAAETTGTHDINEILDSLRRRIIAVFFMIEVSGGMKGARIGAVNDAVRNALPDLKKYEIENPGTEILIAIMEFSSAPRWKTLSPVPVSSFHYDDTEETGGGAGVVIFEKSCVISGVICRDGDAEHGVEDDVDVLVNQADQLVARDLSGINQRSVGVGISDGDGIVALGGFPDGVHGESLDKVFVAGEGEFPRSARDGRSDDDSTRSGQRAQSSRTSTHIHGGGFASGLVCLLPQICIDGRVQLSDQILNRVVLVEGDLRLCAVALSDGDGLGIRQQKAPLGVPEQVDVVEPRVRRCDVADTTDLNIRDHSLRCTRTVITLQSQKGLMVNSSPNQNCRSWRLRCQHQLPLCPCQHRRCWTQTTRMFQQLQIFQDLQHPYRWAR